MTQLLNSKTKIWTQPTVPPFSHPLPISSQITSLGRGGGQGGSTAGSLSLIHVKVQVKDNQRAPPLFKLRRKFSLPQLWVIFKDFILKQIQKGRNSHVLPLYKRSPLTLSVNHDFKWLRTSKRLLKMLQIGKSQAQINQKYQNCTNTDKVHFLKTSVLTGCSLKLRFVLDSKHWLYVSLRVKFRGETYF